MLLPMPGSPPSNVTEPGTMPPPSTRSSSPMPVGLGRLVNGSMSPINRAGDAAGPITGSSRPVAISSTNEFHAPHPAHCPAHFGCWVPHSVQTCSILVRAMRLSMTARCGSLPGCADPALPDWRRDHRPADRGGGGDLHRGVRADAGGFGFALLAMPIMTLAIPVEEAVVIVAILALVTTLWQSIHLRHDADPALVKRLTIASFVGMPLGLVVLNVVDDTTLKIVLGVSVLIATFLLARRLNLSHVGPGLDRIAGFTVRCAQHLARHERSAAGVRAPGARPRSRSLPGDDLGGLRVRQHLRPVVVRRRRQDHERRPARRRHRRPGVAARAGPRLAGPSPRPRRALPLARADAAVRSQARRRSSSLSF